MNRDYDILIVGAGIVGISLMLALSHLPLRIALIEKRPFKNDIALESKPIALNYASVRLLKALMPWSTLSAYTNPIETVHISEQGCFAVTRITAKEMGVKALGYVVSAAHLSDACLRTLNQLTEKRKGSQFILDLLNPAYCQSLKKIDHGWEVLVRRGDKPLTIRSQLIIAADGSHSLVRNLLDIRIQQQSEDKKALVTTLGLSRHHNHVAYQRFTHEGIIACLPLLGNNVGFVCTAASSVIDELALLTESDFLARLQAQFAYRLGKFLESDKVTTYPIRSFIAETQAQPGMILLGNAAHTLSPIAAQGLNLALQDVAELADILTQACYTKKAFFDPLISQAYLSNRLPLQKQLMGFTETLGSVFKQKFTPLTLLRNHGLLAVDLIPALKKKLSRRLMGMQGRLSPLVCGSYREEEKYGKI